MLWQVSYAHADRVLVTTGSALALGLRQSNTSQKIPSAKPSQTSALSALKNSRNQRKVCNDHMNSTKVQS